MVPKKTIHQPVQQLGHHQFAVPHCVHHCKKQMAHTALSSSFNFGRGNFRHLPERRNVPVKLSLLGWIAQLRNSSPGVPASCLNSWMLRAPPGIFWCVPPPSSHNTNRVCPNHMRCGLRSFLEPFWNQRLRYFTRGLSYLAPLKHRQGTPSWVCDHHQSLQLLLSLGT